MEPNKPSAVDEFFQDLPEEDKTKADVFSEKKEEASMKEQDEDPEKAPNSVKDRRHRRLEEKLQRERQSNIELNERLQKLTEAQRTSKETNIDERLLKIFGTHDVGKEIAQHFSQLLSEYKGEAKLEALKEIEQKQAQVESEEKQYEEFIDSELEEIEDLYGVNFSDKKIREGFLTLVEKLSPKDADGNLIEYADFKTTFELYKNSMTRDASRNKQVASKSMQRSQSSTTPQPKITPGFHGWKKDLGLE